MSTDKKAPNLVMNARAREKLLLLGADSATKKRKRKAAKKKKLEPVPTRTAIVREGLASAANYQGVGKLGAAQIVVETEGHNLLPDGRVRKPVIHRRKRHPMSGYFGDSIAALETHRWGTVFGGPNAPQIRKCVRIKKDGNRCGGSAVRGGRVCRMHGGMRAKHEELTRKFADYKPTKSTLAVRALRMLMREGVIPVDLCRHQPFAEVYHRAVRGVKYDNPKFAHLTFHQRRLHHEACALLAVRYLAAWESLVTYQDQIPWVECVRRGNEMGLSNS